MRPRDDFRQFVTARWPDLVASLVDRDVPRARAEQAVVAGLAACQPHWRRLLAEDNPEVAVREQIEAALAGAETSGHDEPVGDALTAIARLRSARRRRSVVLSLVALALVVVGVGVTALVQRPGPYDDLVVHPSRNPLPISWWFGGELHLSRATVEVAGVRSLHRVVAKGVDDAVVAVTGTGDRILFDGHGRASAYDQRVSGRPGPLPHPELIAASQQARSWATTPAGNFVYAVQHRANEHRADEEIRLSTSGPWLILQCSLQAHPGFSPCRTVTQLPADTARPPVFEQ